MAFRNTFIFPPPQALGTFESKFEKSFVLESTQTASLDTAVIPENVKAGQKHANQNSGLQIKLYGAYCSVFLKNLSG